MKFHIIINEIKSVDELSNAWSIDDFKKLLDKFGLEDSGTSSKQELKELLFMAISDYEPNEAAEIILDYRLSKQLNNNQISQISHEMLLDKISEEYSDISLHHELFNISQLLYKAFNGKFPNTKATIIDFKISSKQLLKEPITKENVIKAFDATLAKNHVIKRLFSENIAGNEPFEEADSIIWKLDHIDGNRYQLTTSDYWMSKEDFTEAEFDVEIHEFVEEIED